MIGLDDSGDMERVQSVRSLLCQSGVNGKRGGLYMTLKLGITVLLVVFIAGAVIWLNLRHRKK